MNPVTPKGLCDQFQAFSAEQQEEFLKHLAQISTAKVPLVLASHLSKTEQFKFSGQTFGTVVETMMPLLV